MNGNPLYLALAYLVLGPIAGGLISGIDRKLTSRLQGRMGPPLLQPFYDVSKLFSKRIGPVNHLQAPLVASHLFFAVLTGFFIFGGSDLLLIIFVLTLAGIFLVLAAYTTGSPYSSIGADRELLLMTAYEPMVILMLVGFYKVSGSYRFETIAQSGKPLILFLPGIFLGFVYVLLMKLRKSPFDISTSHHAHQELVMGLTSDLGGPMLAMVELAHWYESVYLYGIVYLFFAWNPIIAVAGTSLTFFAIILIDNTTARVKWEFALGSAWAVALVAGMGNLIPFYLGRLP